MKDNTWDSSDDEDTADSEEEIIPKVGTIQQHKLS